MTVDITAAGAVFAYRFGKTLINQSLPGLAEDGFFRLILRWRYRDGTRGWAPLVGSGTASRRRSARAFEWTSNPTVGLTCAVTLSLHPDLAAWAWNVRLQNESERTAEIDVLIAQDLGLGNEAAVRNSEAFTSQYIDLLPVEDRQFGWVVLARQNLPMDGLHPWLATACVGGAAAYCTDGCQFFGADHRLTGVPAGARDANLPSERLQYEFAMAGLQSRPATVEPGGNAEATFVSRFLPHHPNASGAGDLGFLRDVVPAHWGRQSGAPLDAGLEAAAAPHSPSLFVSSPWLHGDRPVEGDWEDWFGGDRRHEERNPDGRLLSFFCGAATHVVSRDKEAGIARPHGHILRSGGWRWIDPGHLGTTCYAAGIFSAQAYLGNASLARLLPVVRDALGVGRASGQRVFVRYAGAWRQLGVPSAFAMTPSEVRWIYRLGSAVIEARVWCSRGHACAFLELQAGPQGQQTEFLVSHTLALGADEFEHPGDVRLISERGWALCKPSRETVFGSHLPDACFAIAAAEAGAGVSLSNDGPLFADGVSRGEPCVTLKFSPAPRCGVILCGTLAGEHSLTEEVEAGRREWKGPRDAAFPPSPPVRLNLPRPGQKGGCDSSVSRVDEILPWFTHNAAIHFSAPHGLEQHGGGAWGVRDVCQGSVEWLLAARERDLVRRALQKVFSQQYASGGWPQWFMHAPYQSVQHVESHGDVCFWPVKALCDYVEASNDLAFLHSKTGYTDTEHFDPCGPEEPLLGHCDRVIDLAESRFVHGTALVNYGDGDWDDTLQPADPQMRTRMVSSWTVGLAFHTFRQLAEVCRRFGDDARAGRIGALLERMRSDFSDRLMPDSIVAGFVVTERDGSARPLLHPSDAVTGIRFRLLPMTRAVLAELFTPDQASRHMDIVERELLYPDGARLMSKPTHYFGGCEHLFKRADTAANVGREIGLQYVHAHLRYAEAMAKIGDAGRLWTALQVVNPVALAETVSHAAPRQSNVYFSSSDADFKDRTEASRRWGELKGGTVGVRGGWRLYSSGPGIYIRIVRACLLGMRESFGEVIFDPVLPASLDGITAHTTLLGNPVKLQYQVGKKCFAPVSVKVNGVEPEGGRRESNPYREGGLCFPEDSLKRLLLAGENVILVKL